MGKRGLLVLRVAFGPLLARGALWKRRTQHLRCTAPPSAPIEGSALRASRAHRELSKSSGNPRAPTSRASPRVRKFGRTFGRDPQALTHETSGRIRGVGGAARAVRALSRSPGNPQAHQSAREAERRGRRRAAPRRCVGRLRARCSWRRAGAGGDQPHRLLGAHRLLGLHRRLGSPHAASRTESLHRPLGSSVAQAPQAPQAPQARQAATRRKAR